MGGIDLALWDLKARALNVPVYELLGGLNTEIITPYATGFFFTEDDPDSTKYLEEEAEGVLSRKFRALKMKIRLREGSRHQADETGPGAGLGEGRHDG